MPVSLTRRGWYFVIGAGVLGIVGIFINLRDFWYLPALFAAVPVVAVLTALLLRANARLEIRLIAADPTPSVGSTVALTATITHRLPIAIEVHITWVLGEETASEDVSVPRGASRRIAQHWHAEQRGPASVGVRTVLIADPLGLATANMSFGTHATLADALVLPRLLEVVSEQRMPDETGDGAEQPHAHTDQGAGDPGGAMRKYLPGDTKRMVDWKQSARQRELLVRIAETNEARPRRVGLVTEASAYHSRIAFELAVSEAATVAVTWLRSGEVVQLVVGRNPPIAYAAENELLRRLALVQLETGVYAAR